MIAVKVDTSGLLRLQAQLEGKAKQVAFATSRALRTECPPELRVHFVEAGHELGRPAGVLGVEVSPALPVVLSAPAPKRGRR